MKLNVYVSIRSITETLFAHHAVALYPIIPGDQYRAFSIKNCWLPHHPTAPRAEDVEDVIPTESMMHYFHPFIKQFDPNAEHYGLLLVYSSRAVFRDRTVYLIEDVLGKRPGISRDDVSIIFTGEDGASVEISLSEFMADTHLDHADTE